MVKWDATKVSLVEIGDFDTGNRSPLVLGAGDLHKLSKNHVKIRGLEVPLAGSCATWTLPGVAPVVVQVAWISSFGTSVSVDLVGH